VPPWRRLGSLSFLLLALFMFPLPWIRIQCDEKRVPLDAPPAAQGNRVKLVHILLPRQSAETLFSQSGLQAARATCSAHGEGEDARKAEEEAAAGMSASPLMLAWPVFVLGGALAGFLLPTGRRRLATVGACAAVALLLLTAQAFIGFPLEQLMEKTAVEQSSTEPPQDTTKPRSLFDTIGQVISDGRHIRYVMYSTYTPWFYLAVVGVVAPLVLTFFEGWADRRRQRTAPAIQPCEPESPVRSP
jgi:hypothetical protein